jgi:hypothetical protein
MAKTTKQSTVRPLLICPKCKRGEMCLFGIEPESDIRDLYTFECDALEVRGVRVNHAAPALRMRRGSNAISCPGSF